LVGAFASAVECPEPVAQEVLEAEIEAAEQAYMNLDDIGFMDHVNLIAGLQLPCVGESIRRPVISKVHRLMAIHLYALGNDEDAMKGMEAARHAFDHPIDDMLLPPDHDLRVRYEATTEPAELTLVPEPRVGSLSFDGTTGRERADGLPVVVQFFDSVGMAQQTLYLGPRESLPTYSAIPRKRNRLLACTGGASLLSASTLGLGWAMRTKLYNKAADPTTSADNLDGLRGATNIMSFTSGLTAGVAIGCGIGAGVMGEQ